MKPEQSRSGRAFVPQQPFQPFSLVAALPSVQPLTVFSVVFLQRAKTQISVPLISVRGRYFNVLMVALAVALVKRAAASGRAKAKRKSCG